MNALEYKLTIDKINQAKYVKDVEAIARDMYKERYNNKADNELYAYLAALHSVYTYYLRSSAEALPAKIVEYLVRSGANWVHKLMSSTEPTHLPKHELMDYITKCVYTITKIKFQYLGLERTAISITVQELLTLIELYSTHEVPYMFKLASAYASDDTNKPNLFIDRLLSFSYYEKPAVIAEFAKLYLPKLDKPYSIIELLTDETSYDKLSAILSSPDIQTMAILNQFTKEPHEQHA